MEHSEEIRSQFILIQALRDFFNKRDFLDVLTPPMVENPGMEIHIHPFSVHSKMKGKDLNYYLHTSPEFYMKWLLANGMKKIFQIAYAFRDEPKSPHHRPQFLMLEWYRKNERYEKIMDDIKELINQSYKGLQEAKIPLNPRLKDLSLEKYTIQELFQEYLKIDILNFLEKKDLHQLIEKDFKEVPIPKISDDLLWEDLYFLLFLNKVEKKLTQRKGILLYEFPNHLSALSTLKESDQRVCERFEVYLEGIELCNCFNELTDYREQKKRFENQKKLKKDLYQYELPEPTVLWDSFKKGLPKSAGVALGIERLLMALTQIKNPFFN